MDTILNFLPIISLLIPGGGILSIILFIIRFRNANPYKRLAFSLTDLQYISTNKKTLKCLVRNYVPQELTCWNDGNKYSTKRLLSRINNGIKDNIGIFLILGGSGIGKSTIMRYIFCKLSKPLFKNFIYIPMRCIGSRIDFENFIGKYKIGKYRIREHQTVTLFLDGLDESPLFTSKKMQLKTYIQETFNEIKGICSGFDCGCLVISARTEIFNSEHLESLTGEGHRLGKVQVFELMKFEEKQIIKTYNHLEKIKKVEQKTTRDKMHYQNAYPDRRKKKKYLKCLKNILKNSKKDGVLDSPFQYPLFIRYACPYIENLLENYNDNTSIPHVHADDFKKAFDEIIRSVLKWDYRIFFEASSGDKKGKIFNSFVMVMRNFILDVVSVAITQDDLFLISRNLISEKLIELNERIIEIGGSLNKKFKDTIPTPFSLYFCFKFRRGIF